MRKTETPKYIVFNSIMLKTKRKSKRQLNNITKIIKQKLVTARNDGDMITQNSSKNRNVFGESAIGIKLINENESSMT